MIVGVNVPAMPRFDPRSSCHGGLFMLGCGYEEKDIVILVDTPGQDPRLLPTKNNIVRHSLS